MKWLAILNITTTPVSCSSDSETLNEHCMWKCCEVVNHTKDSTGDPPSKTHSHATGYALASEGFCLFLNMELSEFACHPCTGAILIFSILFYFWCRSY